MEIFYYLHRGVREYRMRTRPLVQLSLLTAFTTVATMSLSIYIPATRGYFNVGEIMVYISAIVGGPYIGGFAGGVGSMLADVFLQYYIYAPATLMIKGTEGFITGFIARRYGKKTKMLSILLLLSMGAISLYLSLGDFMILVLLGNEVRIPNLLWLILSAVLIVLSTIIVILKPETSRNVLAMSLGGGIMVIGYFVYESILFGFGAAFVEVPINIAQVAFGIIGALPIARVLERAVTQA